MPVTIISTIHWKIQYQLLPHTGNWKVVNKIAENYTAELDAKYFPSLWKVRFCIAPVYLLLIQWQVQIAIIYINGGVW